MGTVRVHIVLSATNDSGDILSLATTERTFRLVNSQDRLLLIGRFAYAFPYVVAPGEVSYLITTVVLPPGSSGTNLQVEADLRGDVTKALPEVLGVTELQLASTDGNPRVSGVVHNSSGEDVRFGVVGVIGRDESGAVVGGWYDNVNAASVPAGGEAPFFTEYPGLPPTAVNQIVELTAVAFDGGPAPVDARSWHRNGARGA